VSTERTPEWYAEKAKRLQFGIDTLDAIINDTMLSASLRAAARGLADQIQAELDATVAMTAGDSNDQRERRHRDGDDHGQG
jgi:hypothetical protein